VQKQGDKDGNWRRMPLQGRGTGLEKGHEAFIFSQSHGFGDNRAMQRKQKVVVGLSGGVDSAVSAWLLKQQGHEVIGIFMKNWEDDDSDVSEDGKNTQYCSTRQDFLDAAACADVLGIEIEHVNFAAEYKDRVFAEFLREYQAGRTPNPDVLCNAEIKFKAFLDHAMRLGADRIATGHYARVREVATAQGPVVQLLRGLDTSKDQSYFLHRLSQHQLASTWFPVGQLHKTQVRQIASEIGLPNATKKDSTGICFIGERPFREFLNRYISRQPGPIKNDKGDTIGEHQGLSFYTLGQRQGLGIGGVKAVGAQRGEGSHAPWFVAHKDIEENTLWVVQGHDHPWLNATRLQAQDASWVAGSAPLPGAYPSKTRYRQADAQGHLAPGAAASGGFSLQFDTPQWAVTPGQSAVVYDGEVCLGGGVIAEVQTVKPWVRPAAPVRHRRRVRVV
jgi:tRNA-specific 2-thiouridylase